MNRRHDRFLQHARGPVVVGRGVLACVLSCTGLVTATTMTAATAATTATPESVAKETLLDALAPALAARGATATVTVSAPDARRALAPCNQSTGFLPAGARLSGRTLVGVRCVEGASWQTFVAAEVRVEGDVWQSTRALRAGEPLGAGDVTMTRAVLSAPDLDAAGRGASTRTLASLDGRLPAPLGRIVQRPVAMGRPLAASDVRDEGRIGAGDPVRVVYRGEGFSVSSEGHATGAADPGSTVSIRLASGAVVAGTLRADHLVELPR